jgi:hypothetical protein
MRRFAATAAFALALFLFAAVPAMAAPGHTITSTEHQHGSWVEYGDTNPVTGDTIDVHFDGNSVQHMTYFPAGDEVWATFTETGSIWFVDNGVTYSGHATVWGNFNLNQRNSNQTFTLTVHAIGTDGTSVWVHETSHITYNGNGVITVAFDKLRLD